MYYFFLIFISIYLILYFFDYLFTFLLSLLFLLFSQQITAKEFKALLYSVGEELSKAQTHEIFQTYAVDEKISKDSYLTVLF